MSAPADFAERTAVSTASTAATSGRSAQIPVWRLAVASFLPRGIRVRADRWIARVPLALIMMFQAVMSVRLDNSTHSDEGLYLSTGHWIRSGEEVYSQPETFFSGAPSLYPVFASFLDSVGGLELVRAFSALCMVSATLAVYWTTSHLFPHSPGQRAGLYAALVFALSAPVMFLGNLATFDAPSFACLAWAMALVVWASSSDRSVWWGVLIGGLGAFAVLLKYSSMVDVPFVLMGTLVVWKAPAHRMKNVLRGILAGTTTLAVLGVSVATWAREEFAGFIHTTLNRHVPTPASPVYLIESVFTWTGVTLSLMVLGGLYLLRRQPMLALLLLTGTCAAMASQIRLGESTSLHKHVVLGLIFGAPLAGHLLAEVSRRFKLWGGLVTVMLLWSSLLLGLAQSASLFTAWPNTKGLVETIEYSVDAMPWIRTVGDVPEAVEYAFRDRTEHWQWTATWENSFSYKELSGVEAYEQALKDNYFQLAFFDTTTNDASSAYCGACTAISGQLIPQMESFGFEKTGQVESPDGHVWTIWQRYDDLS